MKMKMKISHHSSHQQARKGVIIVAKHEHTIMEGSLRESVEPGNIAAAVYEVNKSRTVVIGVYGISENNDRSSADLIQEVSNIARELKHLYNTQHVIVAGTSMRSYHQKTQTTIISEKREQRGNCTYCWNNMTSQIWLLLQTNIRTLCTDGTATNPQGLT